MRTVAVHTVLRGVGGLVLLTASLSIMTLENTPTLPSKALVLHLYSKDFCPKDVCALMWHAHPVMSKHSTITDTVHTGHRL